MCATRDPFASASRASQKCGSHETVYETPPIQYTAQCPLPSCPNIYTQRIRLSMHTRRVCSRLIPFVMAHVHLFSFKYVALTRRTTSDSQANIRDGFGGGAGGDLSASMSDVHAPLMTFSHPNCALDAWPNGIIYSSTPEMMKKTALCASQCI